MSNKNAINLQTPDRSATTRPFISFILGAALLVLAMGFAVQAGAQALSSRNALNRLAQQAAAMRPASYSAAAAICYRTAMAEGRRSFVNTLPDFPMKNMTQRFTGRPIPNTSSSLDQCKTTLNRLLTNYQKSSWKDDARTLLAQI
jgi:hypothetical protein